MQNSISTPQFHDLTRPLIGLPVSKTWQGIGSSIFFELGKLTETKRTRKNGISHISYRGEAGIMLEWSWRIERPKSIYMGSWSGERKITNGLNKLQNSTIIDITTEGRLPELVIQLSGGYWVHSFSTFKGQPKWCLFLDYNDPMQKNLTSHLGKLILTSTE
jgi:hypothetical protein